MLDIGWTEMLMIGAVSLIVFGPDDIPKIMYNAGKLMRRFKYMRYALSSQFEDFMDKAETTAKPQPKKAEQPARDTHENDESEADEYLMDLLPPPDKDMPEIAVNIPDEPEKPSNGQPDRATPDRG